MEDFKSYRTMSLVLRVYYDVIGQSATQHVIHGAREEVFGRQDVDDRDHVARLESQVHTGSVIPEIPRTRNSNILSLQRSSYSTVFLHACDTQLTSVQR